MKWQYSGKADITLGKEVHINPLPKIALIATVSLIVISCALGFIFRNYLYDLTINPQLILKYVNQTENGYEVDVPYQYNFLASNFIDEVNTREYDAFMNPDNLDYVYSIEGEVDTNTLGSYQVVYNSNNSAKTQQLVLTVNVKDTVAPIATLQNPLTHKELSKDATGAYKPFFIVRNENSTNEFYGTKSWKAEDFVLDYSDNCSNTTITYPEDIDWSGTETDYKELTYAFVDESGNTTNVILPLYIVSKAEYETQDIKVGGLDLNDEIKTQIEEVAQATHDNNNNNKPSNGGNGDANDPGPANSDIDPNNDDSWRADNWQDTPTNDDGSHTGRNPQISADSFTWSISADGAPGGDPTVMAQFLARAQSKIHYYDYDKNDAVLDYNTGGVFVSYQPDGPGTYTLNWKTSDGSLSCTQYVTITE